MLRLIALACAAATMAGAAVYDPDLTEPADEVVPVDLFTIQLDQMKAMGLAALADKGLMLETGGMLRVAVQENPSTGTKWNVVPNLANGAFAITEDFVPFREQPGSPGVRYFTLDAGDAAADGTFSIWLGRSWEGVENAQKSFTFPIHVVQQ